MFRHAKSLIDAAASGAWATRERLCAYAALLIGAYVLAFVALVLTGEGITDHSGRLIGTDFGMIWSAGRTALAGRADEVFSLAAQAIVQRDTFGEAAGFTPWHYPPTFLLLAAPLAALPYLAALAVWQAATFSGYLIGLARLRAAWGWRVGVVAGRELPGGIHQRHAWPERLPDGGSHDWRRAVVDHAPGDGWRPVRAAHLQAAILRARFRSCCSRKATGAPSRLPSSPAARFC